MRLKLKMKGVIRLSEPPNQRIPAIGSLPLSPDPFHTASLLDTDSGTGHYMGWGRRASGSMARRAQGEGGSFFHAGPPHLQQEGCSYELASTLPEHGIRIGTIPVAQRRVRRVPACAGGVGASRPST
jgi:hypothetical protein